MDPKDVNQNSQAKADKIARQYRAGILAAEAIDNAEVIQDDSPGKIRRVQKNLNDDFGYLNENSTQDAYAPTNEKYARNAYKENTLQPTGIGSDQKPVKPKTYRYTEEGDFVTRRRREIRQGARDNLADSLLPKKLSLAKTALGRAKVSTINISALSWGVFLWMFVQVPFALLGLISLGIVAAVDAMTSSEGGFWGWLVEKAVSIADEILKFVGLDFSEIAFNVFTFSYTIVLATGLLMIGILYFQYKLGLLNPIFGKGAPLKIGMLLLTIIGLVMPVLNLFPFIVLWMGAVWINPR